MGLESKPQNIEEALKKQAELEEQLKHLQKMDAVSQLTSGIAHDFNNLLTAIIGNGYLLQSKLSRDSGLLSYVDNIISTSERAVRLTRKLLAFHRKQGIEVKSVDLNDIIGDIEKLLLRIIGEDVTLKVRLSNKKITVLADPGEIEQVLINLAVNARDAMPGGGLLSIRTDIVDLDNSFVKIHSYGRPGRYALITVSDTGLGMDKYTREKIFDPFFTTKEAGKGAGLGLSIVYEIIKQHNGYINVYSVPSHGTTFKIYLPITKSTMKETKRIETILPEGGTETILLTEDEAEVRELARRVLEGFGYRIIEASDGEEAVAIFREIKEKINLIILDVIMPKKNGKDTYNEVVKLKPDIKAIFTSGYDEEIMHKKGFLERGVHFLSKPFIPTELLRKVRDVLDS